MGKNFVVEETEGFRRVWNFVVPLSKLGNNGHIQSIPPLTKKLFQKKTDDERQKKSLLGSFVTKSTFHYLFLEYSL